MANINQDIVIIGAGPAGLSLARSLAHTGLNIVIVEKLTRSVLARPPMDGRDIALTHLSARILKDLEIWPRLPEDAVSMIKEARVLNGSSPFSLHFDARDTGKSFLGYMVSNHLIRKAAYESVSDVPNVELITGVEAQSVTPTRENVSILLADGRELEAFLVVAADSRFSATRRRMGIPANMRDFGRTVIVGRMKHEKPHHDIAYECFHYDQTLAVLPLAGRYSSVVITLSSEKCSHVMNMDVEVFNTDVQARFANRLGWMKLVGKRYTYPLVAVYADRFVERRFALIGDAAVGMHPVTAHGFNLGLRGVHSLAGAITVALEKGIDIGSSSVLERYQSRHKRATRPLYVATNAIVGLYTSESFSAKVARSALLRLGSIMKPAKRVIVNQLTDAEPGKTPRLHRAFPAID